MCLADLDSRLQDCDNMLRGYTATVQQLAIDATTETLAGVQKDVSGIVESQEEASNEEETE